MNAEELATSSVAWGRFWNEVMSGVELAENEHDDTWAAALALILLWEKRMRRRIVQRASRVDISDRIAVRRFRTFVRREVDTFTAGLSRDLVGRSTVGVLDPAGRRGSVRGIQGKGIRQAAAIQKDTWLKAVNASEKAGVAANIVAASAGPFLPGLPEAASTREAEDLEDTLIEADDNPFRNIRFEADRAVESIIGLTSRYSRSGSAADVISFMLGQEDRRKSGDGWKLNRGWMKLAVAAHVRAIHRRRTVSDAVAAGIEHFRLDVPKRRLGRISADGLLGRQLWRVRTLAEWQDVHRKVNEGRNASSVFDSLGLGYGDVSYIVPVPRVMLTAARKQGVMLRTRWLKKKTKQQLKIRRAA